MSILKKKAFLVSLMFFLSIAVIAQTKDEQDVGVVVEKFRTAVVDANKTALEKLTADKLSYGHSAGFVENKQVFINNLVTGKSDFVTLNLSDQTISISDNIAVVRNKLDATTNDDGQPGEAHLLVLMVWQKKAGQWKLLARQAVKQVAKS